MRKKISFNESHLQENKAVYTVLFNTFLYEHLPVMKICPKEKQLFSPLKTGNNENPSITEEHCLSLEIR